jgi:hypothetical protein
LKTLIKKKFSENKDKKGVWQINLKKIKIETKIK